MLKRRDKKKKKAWLWMPGIFLLFSWVTTKVDTDGTKEQLTQGLWVCWFGGGIESSARWTKCHRGLSASRMRLLMYRPTAGRLVLKGCSFPHEEGPALNSMLPSLGNQPARMTSTGKLPSTSAFFFSSQTCSRFGFNAFLCSFVFSCKNLTVLECLYFIKCVKNFGCYILELL